MDLSLSDASWSITDLTELEFRLLGSVPDAADPSGCEKAQDRLYPPPIHDPGAEDFEFVQEWTAYVTDELVTRFSEDIDTFTSDLTRAAITGKDEEGKPVRTLKIPLSHAQNWFSALNQARLVMADVHGIYDEDGDINPREDEEFADFHQRWRYYIQSNYYAGIQEWLIENALS